MSAPDNDPAWYHHPTEAPRCSVPGCNHGSHLLSLWAGKRCRHHAAVYDAEVTARLIADGWPATAEAYRHTFRETT